MLGMIVIGGILVVSLALLTFFKIKWNRADKAVARGRADRIEKERIETVAKTEARGMN